MLMKQIIDAYEVLDSSFVTGEAVKEYLLGIKEDANVEVYELVGPKGSTDMLKVRIPGKNGKTMVEMLLQSDSLADLAELAHVRNVLALYLTVMAHSAR